MIEALKTKAVEPKIRRGSTYEKPSRQQRPADERILLRGLVERSVVTDSEFEWMQQRLTENQHLALNNTKLRLYGLKGIIRCTGCGKAYVGVTLKRR